MSGYRLGTRLLDVVSGIGTPEVAAFGNVASNVQVRFFDAGLSNSAYLFGMSNSRGFFLRDPTRPNGGTFLGIGTQAPQYNLHVTGTAGVSGALAVTSSIFGNQLRMNPADTSALPTPAPPAPFQFHAQNTQGYFHSNLTVTSNLSTSNLTATILTTGGLVTTTANATTVSVSNTLTSSNVATTSLTTGGLVATASATVASLRATGLVAAPTLAISSTAPTATSAFYQFQAMGIHAFLDSNLTVTSNVTTSNLAATSLTTGGLVATASATVASLRATGLMAAPTLAISSTAPTATSGFYQFQALGIHAFIDSNLTVTSNVTTSNLAATSLTTGGLVATASATVASLRATGLMAAPTLAISSTAPTATSGFYQFQALGIHAFVDSNLTVTSNVTTSNVAATSISTTTLAATNSITAGSLRAPNIGIRTTTPSAFFQFQALGANAFVDSNLTVTSNVTTSNVAATILNTGALVATATARVGSLTTTGAVTAGSVATTSLALGTTSAITAPSSYQVFIQNTHAFIHSNLTVTSNVSTNSVVASNVTATNINFTGTLLQNGLPYIGSQWTTSNLGAGAFSVFLRDSNVGIGGTMVPRFPLEVTGTAAATNFAGIAAAFSNLAIASNIVTSNLTTINLNFTGSLLQNGRPYIGSQWTTSNLGPGSNLTIFVPPGCNVGIGSRVPRVPLDVVGTVRATMFEGDASGLCNLAGQLMYITGGGLRVVNQRLVVDGDLILGGRLIGGCNTQEFNGGALLPSYISQNTVTSSNLVDRSVTFSKLDPSAYNFQWLQVTTPGGGLRTTQRVIIDGDLVIGGNLISESNTNQYTSLGILAGPIAPAVVATSNIIDRAVTTPKVDFSSNLPVFFGDGVGIGTTVPLQRLHVVGNIFATGDITAASDSNLKTDLAPIRGALDKVRQLTGYTFARLDDPTGARHAGLLAQEVLRVLPEAVYPRPAVPTAPASPAAPAAPEPAPEELLDTPAAPPAATSAPAQPPYTPPRPATDTLSLAYGNLVALLVEAVKDLYDRNEALTAEVAELRGAVTQAPR